MKYCRRCDLAFCKRHLHCHVNDEHTLQENIFADYCSVCIGIWRCDAPEISTAELDHQREVNYFAEKGNK